jgi:hypothetical protein
VAFNLGQEKKGEFQFGTHFPFHVPFDDCLLQRFSACSEARVVFTLPYRLVVRNVTNEGKLLKLHGNLLSIYISFPVLHRLLVLSRFRHSCRFTASSGVKFFCFITLSTLLYRNGNNSSCYCENVHILLSNILQQSQPLLGYVISCFCWSILSVTGLIFVVLIFKHRSSVCLSIKDVQFLIWPSCSWIVAHNVRHCQI